MASAEYTLSLLVKAQDQTKAVFDSIAKNGTASAQQVAAAIKVTEQATQALAKQIEQLKKAQGSTSGGASPEIQQQIGWFQKLKDQAAGLQGQLTQLPLGLGAIGTAAIGSVAGVMSLKVAFDKLNATIDEGLMKYSAAKLGQEQLSTAWQNAGRNMPIEQLKGYMAEVEKMSTFAAPAITQAARNMSIHGAITDEMMERSLKAAANLAAFKGMGIEQAAMMLGRASEGQFFGLQRMGIAISATTKETKNFSDVLNDIERSLGGQASLAAASYHGQLEKIDQAYVKIEKSIGAVVEPAAKVFASAKLGFLESIGKQAQESVESGYLQELQTSLEMVSKALVFKPEGESLDHQLKLFMEGIKAQFPYLTEFYKLLEKVGIRKTREEKKGEAAPEQGPETAAGKYVREEAMWAAAQLDAIRAEYDDINAKQANILLPFINQAEQYAKILINIQSDLRNVGEGAKKVIDWKLEEKKAEAYFDRVKAAAELSFESQKSIAWATAASKEEAEKRVFDLENAYSLQKIANAQREHDVNLALKEQEYQKEKAKFADQQAAIDKMTDPTKQGEKQADLNAKLKKADTERQTAQMAEEKKLTEAIQTELKSREDAYQKAQEKQLDLQRQMKDAGIDTQKALTDLATAGASEWEKLGVKLGEANDLLKRAVEELPKSPEKAVEIAKQAQSAFSALKQDIAGLEKNLRDVTSSFNEAEAQIRQATMTPLQKRQDEMRQIEEMMRRAAELRQAGQLQEAESVYGQARGKAVGLAHPAEGQSPYAAQGEAAQYLAMIRGQAEATAKQRLEQGKLMNVEAAKGINAAGGVIKGGLEEQLALNSGKLKNLTMAIIGLTERMSQVKTFAPSQAAQEKAGVSMGEGGPAATPGTPGSTEGQPLWQQGRPEYGTPGATSGSSAGTGDKIQTDLTELRTSSLRAIHGSAGAFPSSATPTDEEWKGMTANQREAWVTTQQFEQEGTIDPDTGKRRPSGTIESGKLAWAQTEESKRLRAKEEGEIRKRDQDTALMSSGLPLDLIVALNPEEKDKFQKQASEAFGNSIETAMTPRSAGEGNGPEGTSTTGESSLVTGLQAVVNNFMKGVEQDAALRREKIQVEIKISNDRGELKTWETT